MRVAQMMEALGADRRREYAGELAHHYQLSGHTTRTVLYHQQAGQWALQRSAFGEAVSHFTTAIEHLRTLPEPPRRTQQELDLWIALGPALLATQGPGAAEVEQAYNRARDLCQQVDDTPQLFAALVGLWQHYIVRGATRTASELAEQLLTLAERLHDDDLLLQARSAMGNTLYYRGEFIAARGHLERGAALHQPQQHRAQIRRYGRGPGLVCLRNLAWTLWVLGYPEQALRHSQQVLTVAQESVHPADLVAALVYSARVHQHRREAHVTQELTEAAMALSREQGFTQRLAAATILHGWALTAQGQVAEGLGEVCHGLEAYQATGAEDDRPYWRALLAEGLGQAGRIDEGLQALTEAMAVVHTRGLRVWEAEVHRLRGELLVAQAGAHHAEAEACFQQALDFARQQHAKAFELRAATSLSRLWQRQGKTTQAHALLAEIYAWFTEGFETVDLQDAKAMLGAF